jgi:hypothetical protein
VFAAAKEALNAGALLVTAGAERMVASVFETSPALAAMVRRAERVGKERMA